LLRFDLKWWICTILVLALLFVYLYVYSYVSRFDNHKESRQQRAVGIVLGAALWNGVPSSALKERCDKAIELFRRGQVQYLLLSGGLESEQRSEAEAMQQYLVEHDIPKDRLLLEDQSTNTRENLLFSRKILANKQVTQAYLITHDFHLARAMLYAKQAGVSVEPVPVHSKVLWPMAYYKTRECLALVKLYLFHR
jgi:uncharacterized SAM-binding protein YcdF (DUF218 family)